MDGGLHQTAAKPAPSMSPKNTVAVRQGRQFDPFWIEAAAAADRAIWIGYPADPTAPTSSGGEILAHQTSEMSLPMDPSAAGSGDHVEGLTHCTFASEGADFDPCISRDGTFMVFASTQHRPTADIYMKPINGRTITQLTSDPAHDLMPAISPDGQRIAFASNRSGNWDIYVMAATGGQAVQLTSDSSQEVHPSWSPDSKRLVFSRFGEMSGRWEMWVMEVNASANAEFLGYGLFPKWCPKGATGNGGRDKILYQRSRERGDRAFGLWTIDYKPGDASSPTEIASAPNTAFINADWSPEGDRIVFASVENPGMAGDATGRPAVADLWMTNIDGSGRVNLTSGKFMNLMPSWSKDGRIYYVSNRSGMTNIWSMGTEKAIYAATGTPSGHVKSEMANVPDHKDANP
jgi:TolB protein